MKLSPIQDIIFQQCSGYYYVSDNNFAYKKDLYDSNPSPENFKQMYADSKGTNFVPTYDKWCLYCGNKSAGNRCAQCKHVYFCDAECQKKAWPIHKKHCKRNLFMNCATCGSRLKEAIISNELFSCDKCPVKWCSIECKNEIFIAHKEFDCKTFHKMFPK